MRARASEARRLREAFDAPILELRKEYAKGFAGSPAFIAPEVIKGENVGYAADWYSLGVLAFRVYAGRLPYEGSTTDEVLINGRDGRVNWQLLPRRENPELLDLIVGLLENDPNKRYGSRAGALHLMRHPYFYGVNWDEIYAQQSPLVDQEAATIAEPPERFTDAMSAVQMIRYSRGTVSSFPLGPRQHRIGGWKGMPQQQHFGNNAAAQGGDDAAGAAQGQDENSTRPPSEVLPPATGAPGQQEDASDSATMSKADTVIGVVGYEEVGAGGTTPRTSGAGADLKTPGKPRRELSQD